MTRLDTTDELSAAVTRLIAIEPRFALVVERHGLPPLRHEEPGLKSLLRIVTDQLISLTAGEAIWNRLARRLALFEPETVLACPKTELRALGLSAAKARTFHAAARTFRDGEIATAGENLSESDLLGQLTGISGVGPWTANIYLLTTVRLADAWPAADLALQRAAMDLFSLPARPDARAMAVLAEPWRPVRSAAALLLWSHYRGLKRMPQG
jgi:DNA-3-methyladenine glycosylase II